MKKSPKGFIPVMLTPFLKDGTVDYDGLTILTEFYLSSGASGLFANCQSSEMFELTDQERLDITRHVVKVANGAVPVVAAGTFSRDLSQQANFVKQIYDTGIEAVIIITGMLAKKDEPDDILNKNVFELINQTGAIPLGFYECPVPYKRVLTAEQLGEFVDTGRIIYHKDTCLDLNLVKAKLEATKGHSFGLYDAYMGHAVESLKAGSAGLSCIQGNYFPELVTWLCKNYNNSELTWEVDQVQQFFIDNMQIMHEEYPVVGKFFLQRRGLNISTFSRQGSNLISKKAKADMHKLQHDYNQIHQLLKFENKI